MPINHIQFHLVTTCSFLKTLIYYITLMLLIFLYTTQPLGFSYHNSYFILTSVNKISIPAIKQNAYMDKNSLVKATRTLEYCQDFIHNSEQRRRRKTTADGLRQKRNEKKKLCNHHSFRDSTCIFVKEKLLVLTLRNTKWISIKSVPKWF